MTSADTGVDRCTYMICHGDARLRFIRLGDELPPHPSLFGMLTVQFQFKGNLLMASTINDG